MRRPSFVAAAALLFVLGGVLGGWWYLTDVVVSTANAQVQSNCGPGRNCQVGTLDVGSSGPGGAYVRSQASSTTPTEFSADDFVVGRTAASGAASGAVFLRYDSSNSRGFIGSLSPSTAWRDLRIGAAEIIFQDGTGAAKVTIGANTNPGTVTSAAASGSNGFACSTTGCRFDLGGGASDYFYSDGTNLVAANVLEGDGAPAFHATGAGGLKITGVATGSLPACASNAGLLHYDTSTNQYKYCNGTSYVTLTADTDTNTIAESVAGYLAVNAEETTLAAKYAENSGTMDHLAIAVAVAGAGAAANAVLEVLCDSTQIATASMSCTQAAGSSASFDVNGAVTAGCLVKLQWDTTSECTTLPTVNVNAGWE